jgi:hypothetical protein
MNKAIPIVLEVKYWNLPKASFFERPSANSNIDNCNICVLNDTD